MLVSSCVRFVDFLNVFEHCVEAVFAQIVVLLSEGGLCIWFFFSLREAFVFGFFSLVAYFCFTVVRNLFVLFLLLLIVLTNLVNKYTPTFVFSSLRRRRWFFY